jgi:hypothetical protein
LFETTVGPDEAHAASNSGSVTARIINFFISVSPVVFLPPILSEEMSLLPWA